MGKSVRTKAVSELFEAILTLREEEECFDFFNPFLPKENITA